MNLNSGINCETKQWIHRFSEEMIGEGRKKIIFSTSFLFFIPVNYKDNTEFQFKKATTKHEKLRKQIAF